MHVSPRNLRESNRDYALRVLKENIVSLTLRPGSKVSENELAEEMGLSRTPVREALMELAKVRMVDVYPQRGSVVSLIDYDLIEETRFMRSVLEGAVVEQACQMASPNDLLELTDNVTRQERYLAAGMPEKLLELDNAFHRMLFVITRKAQTWEMMNSFTIHFDRVRLMSLETVKDSKVVSDHRAIAEALRARDREAARAVMDKHLTRFRIDSKRLRESYPAEYFKESYQQEG